MHNIDYYDDLLVNKNKEIDREKDVEAFWDSRAEVFSNMQNIQNEEIPSKVIQHLIDNNLLNETTTVLDICGGSGRYAIPMAKIAKKVTLTDISSKMLEYAESNAEKENLKNLEYIKLDLDKSDIKEIGWDNKFDLTFASMCPAVRNEKGLGKMIEASKGSCYIGQYVEMTDSISEYIMEELDITNSNDPHNDRDAVYGTFNILWLKGYEPEINYVKEESEEKISKEKIVEKYKSKYEQIAKDKNKDIDEILSNLGDDITLRRKKTFALIFWKVKN